MATLTSTGLLTTEAGESDYATGVITAQNFVQAGSRDPVDFARLDLALRTLSFDTQTYHALMSAMEKGTSISINHNAYTVFDPNTNTIHWDPLAAVAALHPDLSPAGIQSPMMSLIHEVGHALDDNLATNRATPHYGGWINQAEAYAGKYELQAAGALGQFPRTSHYSSGFVKVDNPTTNTPRWPDGSLRWEKGLTNGVIEVGPIYRPEGYPKAPEFGTPGIGGGYGPGPEERAWEGAGGFDYVPTTPAAPGGAGNGDLGGGGSGTGGDGGYGDADGDGFEDGDHCENLIFGKCHFDPVKAPQDGLNSLVAQGSAVVQPVAAALSNVLVHAPVYDRGRYETVADHDYKVAIIWNIMQGEQSDSNIVIPEISSSGLQEIATIVGVPHQMSLSMALA